MRYRAHKNCYLRFKTLPVNLGVLLAGLILYPVIGTVQGLFAGLGDFSRDLKDFWRIFIKGEGY